MNNKRLVPIDLGHGGISDLSDTLYLYAREIEQGFMNMNAVPGEDYTQKDLMEMAIKCVINKVDYPIDVTVYKDK